MSSNRKRRPTHPGAILREDILPETGLTQSQLAELLNVSRRTINEILNERRPVTTDMAQRLARAFGTTPEFWLRLQQAVDIWETGETHKSEYARIKLVAPVNRAQQTVPDDEDGRAGGACELCGKPLILRRGRFGSYFGCSDYPNCNYTRKAA